MRRLVCVFHRVCLSLNSRIWVEIRSSCLSETRNDVCLRGAVQFVFVNTSTEYAVPNNYNNCTQYQQRVATQLGALLGASSVSQPNVNTVLVTGRQEAKLPVTSNQITTGCAACPACNVLVVVAITTSMHAAMVLDAKAFQRVRAAACRIS